MDMLGKLMGGEDTVNQLRFPEIMADAAYVILTRDSKNYTRNFCVDEDILKEVGVTDFDVYAVKPGLILSRADICCSNSLTLHYWFNKYRYSVDAGLFPRRIPDELQ